MIKKIMSNILTGVRPLLGPASCYYQESCTPFALRQLKEKNLFAALYAISKRLVLCNPLGQYITRKKMLLVLSSVLFGLSSFTAILAHETFTPKGTFIAYTCDSEAIRSKAVFQQFLVAAAESLGLTQNGNPIIQLNDQNGYHGTSFMSDGSNISFSSQQQINQIAFQILTTRTINRTDFITLIKKYFSAQKVTNQ